MKNIFDLHSNILSNYKDYINSFINIKDARILAKVKEEFEGGRLYPEALIQFNPSFESGGTVSDLITEGILSKEFDDIFYDDTGTSWSIYKHQSEAIKKGNEGNGFVVTSGTGSGKSLIYISTIFNFLFKNPSSKGIKAIIVYPLNALINSQESALVSFNENYKQRTGHDLPFTFAKFSGQEKQEARDRIISNPPDILLTNYMMLELLMVRKSDERLRNSFLDNLKFIVFDELHVYKGRQGADVSLLIRRIKALATNKNITCIGTSATMVSGGSVADQKKAVAKVAQSFFDHPFSEADIVSEYLAYSTADIPIEIDKLRDTVLREKLTDKSIAALINDPLAIWLERVIAIKNDTDHKIRNNPKTLLEISQLLSKEIAVEIDRCREKIIEVLTWAESINVESAKVRRKETILPFKLHQFISQTGFAYVTLEEPSKREITLDPTPTIKKAQEELPVFQTVFGRVSGHEYICVRKDNSGEGKLLFRDLYDIRNPTNDEDLKINDGKTILKKKRLAADFKDGYVVFETDVPIWMEEYEEILPDTWFTKSGQLEETKKIRLPKAIYVDKYGNFSEKEENGMAKAWFITAPLLFDPTSGLLYLEPKLSEQSKLISLGNEGRSTSTTILSLNTLLSLHQAGTPEKQQKLMSFTDNRQDASLQSGHFNDFIQVVQLRSAIEKTLQHRPAGLGIHELVIEVERQLNLKEDQYARNPAPDPRFPNEDNKQSLRAYLTYRILQDLERGWRYVLPNLEQTALLDIDYKRLAEFVAIEEFWRDLELFDEMAPEERHACCVQILNFFRTNFAIDLDTLRYGNRQQLQNTLKDVLDAEKLWSLDKTETIEAPAYLSLDGADKGAKEVFISSMGAGSRLGRFIKYLYRQYRLPHPRGSQYKEYVGKILDTLYKGNFLRREMINARKGDKICYQLIVNSIIWKRGDKINVLPDLTSVTPTKELRLNTHKYFQQLYQFDFSQISKSFHSKEHTGQISNEDKQRREEEFNDGRLSALYCSPTMELGIDISSLNIVHMRNVPPSPANYAQRSGRAGRSGQSALIFTYASNTSPHDRHYFENKIDMVSGRVQPPRIDLTNEGLIKAHLHSAILCFLSAEEFTPQITSLVDMYNGSYSLKHDIEKKYHLVIQNNFDKIKNQFKEVIKDIPLSTSKWFTEKWLDKSIKGFTAELQIALKRWRQMYADAIRQMNKAHAISLDPIVKDAEVKRNATISYARAKSRKGLLENDMGTSNNSTLSEFYTFRYFASEGFFPGYNFARLPIRVYLGSKDKNEYVSRSRFIAIKEFGPNNLIYHNGAKYKVNRIALTDVTLHPKSLTIFKETNYAFMEDQIKGVNQDPITGKEMKADSIIRYDNLVEMDEVQSESNERISCMEEVRASEGYEVHTYLNTFDSLKDATKISLTFDSREFMRLFYSPSANIVLVNKKWRKTNSDGYWIGEKSGFFKRQKEIETPNPNDLPKNITLFTHDTSDILYIQPVQALNLTKEGVITLQYALEKAIEQHYNIEAVEIDAQLMGSGDNSNIMLYESAEGSIGVLKDIADNPVRLRDIFKIAYEICGYDLLTHQDKYPTRPKATYDDLLSYYNQSDHSKINRHSIKLALEVLMASSPDDTVGGSYEAKYEKLKKELHSKSPGEAQLLDFLFFNGYRLPDYTNHNMEDFFIQPDFVYEKDRALIFVDGGIHNHNNVKVDDEKKRRHLELAGYDILVWRESIDPLESFISSRQDIFRKIR